MRWDLWGLIWLGCLLAGCSDNFSVVRISRGTWQHDEQQWIMEKEPRIPRTPKEEQIVTAAELRQTIKTVEVTYGYLGLVGTDRIVVVFEENRFSPHQFSPKPVERYLIRSGRIVGYLSTVEALPDVEFERAVYDAARSAHNESRFAVLIVRNRKKPLTMKASFVGSCTVSVDVIDGMEPYGTILCQKQVNFCFPISE